MKVWGRIRKNNKTIEEAIVDINAKSIDEVDDWSEPLSELCHDLDLSRPILLKKHLEEIDKFSSTSFSSQDFIESISFDKLEIEIF